MTAPALELIQAVSEPMAVFSLAGELIAANSAFSELFGCTAAALRGRNMPSLFGPSEVVDRYFAACCSASTPLPGTLTPLGDANRQGYRSEGATFRSGEGERYVWVRLIPRTDAIKHFALLNEQIHALSVEITARQRSEAALREAHERLAFLAQATAVLSCSLDYEANLAEIGRLMVPRFADWSILYIVDSDGVLRELATYHSDPAQRELANAMRVRYPMRPDLPYGAPQVVRAGKTEIMTAIPDSVLSEAAVDAEHLQILRETGLRSYICVPLLARQNVLGALMLLTTAESERRYSDDDVELLEDLGRRCGAAIDQARLFRDAVRASTLLDTVLRQMPVGVVIAEAPSGKIIFNSNPGMMGEDFKPVSSVREFSKIVDMIPETPVQDWPLVRALHGEIIPDENIHFVRTDGARRTMHTSSTPVYDAEGKIIAAVSIYHDVTDKLAADEALRRSEKLAAAGRFAATVAHEINNPLEAATNLLYLAKIASHGKVREYLEMAEHELTRVGHMAKQTLGFYRDTTAPRDLFLAGVIKDVVSLYAKQAEGRGISVETEVRGTAEVHACEGEIKQIVSNLVANAIDACGWGGRVIVRVGTVNGRARITVADNGSGIPRQNLRKIWEPFFTTKQQSGTGLGLWVTKDMVAKNGGRIAVRSRQCADRSGSAFVVSFPLIEAAAQSTPAVAV